MSDDVFLGSADALSLAIHARDISCVEVMQATLDRVDRLNPTFHAIVSRQPTTDLLRQAAEHDGLLDAGQDLGWMHGFPMAPKDLTDAAGIPTVRGSRLFLANVPHADGIQVQRMRAAGGIVIGKTNTPEHGLGSHTYNDVFGVTRNAWDPTVSAGGSSGGAAVALALGLLAVADGSDMMGSLRNPAGWNAVYGLRPTPGRVPSWPVADVFQHQLSTEGPMARTVSDLARLLSIQAGHDPRLPLSLLDDPQRFAEPLTPIGPGVRIGWLGDLEGYLAVEPGVRRVCEQALTSFATVGCEVQAAVPFFDHERLWEAWVTLRSFQISGSLSGFYDNAASRAMLKPEVCWEIEHGRARSLQQVFEASLTRTAWHQAVLGAFDRYDVLVLPSAQCAPFPAHWTWPRSVAGRSMDTYHRWMEVVVPGSMAAVPVLCIPAGFDQSGLPAGLQLIGRPGGEAALMRLAYALDQAVTGERPVPPAARVGFVPPARQDRAAVPH